jgi:hypothetical protein
MRIAAAAVIALRPIKPRGHFQKIDELDASNEPAPRPDLLIEVCARIWGASDLQLHARAHRDIRIALGDQARPRLDLVRILRAGRGGVDADLVAADLIR